jgi:hypothetical protein
MAGYANAAGLFRCMFPVSPTVFQVLPILSQLFHIENRTTIARVSRVANQKPFLVIGKLLLGTAARVERPHHLPTASR